MKKALEHYAKIMKKDDSEVTKKMEDYEKCLGKLCKIIERNVTDILLCLQGGLKDNSMLRI